MPEFQACEQMALTQSTCPSKDGLEVWGVRLCVHVVPSTGVCLVCCMCVVCVHARVLVRGPELNSLRSLRMLLGFVSCLCWFPFARAFQLSPSPLLVLLQVKQV